MTEAWVLALAMRPLRKAKACCTDQRAHDNDESLGKEHVRARKEPAELAGQTYAD